MKATIQIDDIKIKLQKEKEEFDIWIQDINKRIKDLELLVDDEVKRIQKTD